MKKGTVCFLRKDNKVMLVRIHYGEQGITCIVGTKIATQVFKNGQTVEVDANQGIIKILN